MKVLGKKRLALLAIAMAATTIWGCGADMSDDDSMNGSPAADGEDWWGEEQEEDWDTATSGDMGPVPGSDDADTGLPPEQEEQANYKIPQGSGQYVFIPDELNDTVVVVDSETLAIEVVSVGARPTQLVALGNTNAAAVINVDSDEVTILRATPGKPTESISVEVRADTNALAATPSGAFLVAYHDTEHTTGPLASDQEITVISTDQGKETGVHLTVGMHPWEVAFNTDETRAFVVTESGIDIIPLDDLDNIGRPETVHTFESGTYGPESADIAITPDGSFAVARKDLSDQIIVASLDTGEEASSFTLPAIPTDLDIAPDGSFAMIVLRAIGRVAILELPLPEEPSEDPFEYVELGGQIVGVASISSDSNLALLHTTVAPEKDDRRRLTTLRRTNGTWKESTTLLETEIRAVAIGADSKSAIAIHQPMTGIGVANAHSYSIVTIPGLQIKYQHIPSSAGQLLFTPDGDFGFLLLPNSNRADVINLRNFIVDPLELGSPPTVAGYAEATNKIFIAQEHPAGRMTFFGVDDSSTKTVTGYSLNDEIEY